MPFGFKSETFCPGADSIWQKCTVSLDKGKLYPHIQKVLQNPDECGSGYIIYSLSEKAADIKNLIMRDMHLITTDNDGQEKVIQFRFGQAEEGKKKNERFFSPKLLIHPASKVGMLILSCSLGDCNYTMDDLQMLNYGIHKTYPIGSSENKAIRIKQLNLNRQENSDCNDEEKAKRVEKMQNLMKNIFGNEDAFNMKMFTEELMAEFKGDYERFDPYRLHVFTYLQTSDTDDKASLLNDFQRIIKIQNSNYKVSNCDKASYEQTFENIYVGSATEGGAIMTVISEETENSWFLRDFHKDSLSQVYLWIYFMVQIQKYTLISIEKSLTEYDFSSRNTSESRRKLTDLIANLTKNKVNSNFTFISSHTQHNKFYSLCCRSHDIERLSEGLHLKISYLKEHLNILINEEEVRLAKIENEISKRRENSMIVITVVGAVMALFSIGYDSFGLMDEEHFMLYNTTLTEPWIRNVRVVGVIIAVALLAWGITSIFLRRKK
jgi:hypothetical protein